MRTTLACLVLLLAAQGAQAGLIDRLHKGKTEEQLAKEFEAGIKPTLEGFLKDPAGYRPVATLEIKKDKVYARLDSMKGDVCTFAKLHKWEWYPQVAMYSMMPAEPKYTVKVTEIPARDIAFMYDISSHTPEVLVSLACWLVAKREVWLANSKIAAMLYKRPEFKDDAESWLCEKHGWTRPEKGMTYVLVHDLESALDKYYAVTADGDAARLAELDKAAAAAAKKLEEQRGDAKGDVVKRRKQPTERLETIKNRLDRFEKAFAGTAFVQNTKNMDDLKALGSGIEADLADVKTRFFAAERDTMDGKWLDAAKKFEVLVLYDPRNEKWVSLAADAWFKAAVVEDGGKKCKFPDAMKKSAQHYEWLADEFPLYWNFHNCAGAAWRALGDAKKAKARWEHVLRNAPETDANRTYAKNQLAGMR